MADLNLSGDDLEALSDLMSKVEHLTAGFGPGQTVARVVEAVVRVGPENDTGRQRHVLLKITGAGFVLAGAALD